MRASLLTVIPTLAALCCCTASDASASLLVDGADITPAGECQLESWLRQHHDGSELAATPACTFGGNEWSLGFTHHRADTASNWALGIKRPLPLPTTSPLQLAVSLGHDHDLRDAHNHGTRLGLPLTVRLDPDGRTRLHIENRWHRESGKRGWSGGVGLERMLTLEWNLLAELAIDIHQQRQLQLGLRRTFGNGASLDLLHGRSSSTNDPYWLSVGLNLPLRN